jgi:DNA-binding transcriptional regulator/RsmH inhibitor MraZ
LGNKLEIWDASAYNEFKKLTDKTYEDIAERIDEQYDGK